MTPRPDFDPVISARIDAYLDGTLSPGERIAFERSVSDDPALGAEVELQQRIDGRLRVLMAAPEAPASPVATGAIAGRVGFPSWLRIAAVIAVVGAGVWAGVSRPWEGLFKPAPSNLSADAVVKRLIVDEGFKPMWVCDDDAKFLAYTQKELKTPFLVRPAPGVQLVGWAYAPGLLAEDAEPAKVLLVRAEGKEVVVAMGPRADDRTVHTDPGSHLNIHRKVYKGVVMYEISPLDHAVVLPAVGEP
jgi:hypothetical protein